MNIVCMSTLGEDEHPTPDVLVLPERVPPCDLEAAARRWPNAVVVGAVKEGRHIRAYAMHAGKNLIDYLKFSDDRESDGTRQYPVRQTFELGNLMIGVLVCRDFEQPALLEAVMNRVRGSSAARKIVCIPADMGPEWFPGNHVREFLGAYVALSNNLRKPDQTRRASFILTPDGTFGCEQANHQAITLHVA